MLPNPTLGGEGYNQAGRASPHLVGHEGAVGVLDDGREGAVVVQEHGHALAARARRELLEAV